MENFLKKLLANRYAVLFIELAGLLHDIGKLSAEFIDYRMTWQFDSKGFDKDPHDHEYLAKHERFPVPKDFKTDIKSIANSDCNFCEPDFSIEKAVHNHVNPPAGALINMMLKAADGVDAAYDRNNPLWCNEQKDKLSVSNVFGWERQTDEAEFYCLQENKRKELYALLSGWLPRYFVAKGFGCDERGVIIKAIKAAFDHGLSDTTRPQNDTSLWEHSYSVSSILKAITVHNLLNDTDKIYKREDVRFGILGIGWDGMRFLSNGQKIGDITGRYRIIEQIKEHLRKLIEYDYPIGNEVYADDDGIYFLVISNLNKYADLWEAVERNLHRIAVDVSYGELQPHVYVKAETASLTGIVDVISKIKSLSIKPFDRTDLHFNTYRQSITGQWLDKEKSLICPICRLRPVSHNTDAKICRECRNRRSNKESYKKAETLFIEEIANADKGSSRTAFIVARFGLDKWLNGDMVRTMFVTEADGINREIKALRLGSVKQFEKKDMELGGRFNDEPYNWNRIKEDIESFARGDDERAIKTACLYHRRPGHDLNVKGIKKIHEDWEFLCVSGQHTIKQGINEEFLLHNILCAKTPTPSTILDVWGTTEEFFKETPGTIIASMYQELPRLRVKVKDLIEEEWPGARDAQVDETGRQIEVLYIGNQEIEIVGEIFTDKSDDNWRGRTLLISRENGSKSFKAAIDRCVTGSPFVPYRIITSTPNLFMAIVPADKAVEVTSLLYKCYIERFGKVMGRLPFSVGNIFFGRKMPMFVVLDAAKRMINNFDSLAKDHVPFKAESKGNVSLDLSSALGKLARTIEWKLPYNLGNCEPDYHHPYFIVKANDKKMETDRSTFFKTITGDVIHFSEVKVGDELRIYPNYYDFEFLDSNTRRHDIALGEDDRRTSNVAKFNSKPVLLDELDQKMLVLWQQLLQDRQLEGVTDTKLRNLQSLWLTKYQEWRVDLSKKSSQECKQWLSLVEQSVTKEFGRKNELLCETIENGVFFDTLELYLGILKQRIETIKGGQ